MCRRKYSDEYKKEALELTCLPGATLRSVENDLGVNEHIPGRWRKALDEHGVEKAFSGQGHARDGEIMQLKRELARVKKERDFLYEAAAFFAKA